MPYNSLTDRSDAGALIPEDASKTIIQSAVEQSAVLTRFRRTTMSRKQQRMPVLSAFPQAYWVDGDTGLKQTTELAWANKYLNAEELAVIVPIPEAVLDDADFDIWGETRPRLAEAIGRAVDSAVFFGTNAPASFPDDVLTAATSAGNTYELGTNDAASGGVAEDINQTMGLVEADGFDVTGFVAERTFRARIRGARATDGQKLMDVTNSTVEGLPISFAMSGLWTGDAKLFAGDWTQFVVAVRQDLTWKVLTEAVITDNTNAIIYNLAQQDMVALRVVFRVAWQVANPMTHSQPTENDRYPAAVLLDEAS